MLQGAFQSMQHDHFFEPLPATEIAAPKTSMKDIFRFAAPLPILGRIAEMLVLRRYMQSLLRERNLIIKQIAESRNDWKKYL